MLITYSLRGINAERVLWEHTVGAQSLAVQRPPRSGTYGSAGVLCVKPREGAASGTDSFDESGEAVRSLVWLD